MSFFKIRTGNVVENLHINVILDGVSKVCQHDVILILSIVSVSTL